MTHKYPKFRKKIINLYAWCSWVLFIMLSTIRMEQLLSILLSIIMVSGCNKSTNTQYANTVEKWIGKEIIIPTIKTNSIIEKEPAYFRVVTRINGDCYPCLERLKLWNYFINDIKKERKVLFNFYIVIADTLKYQEINNKELHFSYPVIFDTDDQFRKLNKLEKEEILQTLLLDRANKVIAIGTPINNSKIRELYKQIIKTYTYD